MDTNLSIDCILKKETLMIKVHVYIKGMQSVYFQGNATHYFYFIGFELGTIPFKNRTLRYYQVGPWQLTLVTK